MEHVREELRLAVTPRESLSRNVERLKVRSAARLAPKCSRKILIPLFRACEKNYDTILASLNRLVLCLLSIRTRVHTHARAHARIHIHTRHAF